MGDEEDSTSKAGFATLDHGPRSRPEPQGTSNLVVPRLERRAHIAYMSCQPGGTLTASSPFQTQAGPSCHLLLLGPRVQTSVVSRRGSHSLSTPGGAEQKSDCPFLWQLGLSWHTPSHITGPPIPTPSRQRSCWACPCLLERITLGASRGGSGTLLFFCSFPQQHPTGSTLPSHWNHPQPSSLLPRGWCLHELLV